MFGGNIAKPVVDCTGATAASAVAATTKCADKYIRMYFFTSATSMKLVWSSRTPALRRVPLSILLFGPQAASEYGEIRTYLQINGTPIGSLDMGKSNAYLENAERLGIDLSEVDVAILSHGHHDHGGGLKRFLETNDRAPVYLSSHAFEPHYSISGKHNGIDCELQKSDRLIYVEEQFEIDEELSLFTCNERERPVRTDNFGQK